MIYIIQFSKKKHKSNINNFRKYKLKKINTKLLVYTIDVDNESILKNALKQKIIIRYNKNRKFKLRTTSNDPYYNDFPFHEIINSKAVWEYSTGGVTSNNDNIVLAITEDRINADHQDLLENIWINSNETIDGVDDENMQQYLSNLNTDSTTDFIDDLYGWDANTNSAIKTLPTTGSDHATACASIMGAVGNNGIGLVGLNWNVKIMQCAFTNMYESEIYKMFSYCIAMRHAYNITVHDTNVPTIGAYIVANNMSWGLENGQTDDFPIFKEMITIMGDVGIMSCGAGPNTNINVDVNGDIPTGFDNDTLISVMNINENLTSIVSGYGPTKIQLGGVGKINRSPSMTSNNSYLTGGDGTSFVCPQIAGTVALIYSMYNSDIINCSYTNPKSVVLYTKHLILDNVKKIDLLQNKCETGGILDLSIIGFKATNSTLNHLNQGYYDTLTVLNVTNLIDNILNNNYNIENDMNNDGNVTILDAIILINNILGL